MPSSGTCEAVITMGAPPLQQQPHSPRDPASKQPQRAEGPAGEGWGRLGALGSCPLFLGSTALHGRERWAAHLCEGFCQTLFSQKYMCSLRL